MLVVNKNWLLKWKNPIFFSAEQKCLKKKKSNLFWDHPSSGPECCFIHLWETLLPLGWYSVVTRQMHWVQLGFLFKLNFQSKSLSEHSGPPASEEHSWFLVYAGTLPTENLEKPRIQSVGRDISSSLICFQIILLGDFTMKFSWRRRPEIITTALIMRTWRPENTHQSCSEFPNQLKWKRYQSSRISASQGGECNSHPLNAGYSLCCLSLLFATPRIVSCQVPLSMGIFRQEYSSGLPFSSSGNLPDPGTEPRSPALQVDSLLTEPPEKPYPLWRPSKEHSMEMGWEVMMQQGNSANKVDGS